MKVLVTGATGVVGREVVRGLLKKGHQVHVLTRHTTKANLLLGGQVQYFLYPSVDEKIPAEAMQGVAAVINLMGEGIADKRWSDEQKQKLIHSRVQGTKQLVEAMKLANVKVLASASAVGIYGSRSSEELNEKSALGNDFLATLCQKWEKEALHAESFGARVAVIRIGIVLSREGGALSKMLPIFKLGGGGPLGSGHQWMSWVHVHDLANMFIEAVENKSLSGAYNGTAPYPVINKEFTKVLGKVLRRPAFAPAPGFMIKLVFGEMSQILLEGQKVLPQRFKDAHFHFKFSTLEMALKDTAG
jgi:uncharacterized protein (TIGR01777 family)